MLIPILVTVLPNQSFIVYDLVIFGMMRIPRPRLGYPLSPSDLSTSHMIQFCTNGRVVLMLHVYSCV